MSRARLLLAALIAVTPLVAACENGPVVPLGGTTVSSTPTTTIDTTVSPVTETFQGLLNVGGYAFRSFTAAKTGTATATLTTVGGAAGTKLGFAIGLPDSTGSTCLYTRSSETAAGGVLSATVDAGTYCVRVWDLGTLATSTSFLVTIVRP